ncbi:MAG: hypothetical protein OXH23_12260 [bacterium]|nr:hypothetical protein [bacterium]
MRWSTALLAALLVVGCASQADVGNLESRIESLETEVESLKSSNQTQARDSSQIRAKVEDNAWRIGVQDDHLREIDGTIYWNDLPDLKNQMVVLREDFNSFLQIDTEVKTLLDEWVADTDIWIIGADAWIADAETTLDLIWRNLYGRYRDS